MKSTLKALRNIDWDLLSQQKLTLLRLLDTVLEADQQYEDLEGIINLLDALQDSAVNDGIFPENVVFNLEEE